MNLRPRRRAQRGAVVRAAAQPLLQPRQPMRLLEEVRGAARRGGGPARAASRRSAASSAGAARSRLVVADAEVLDACTRHRARASSAERRVRWRRAACCRGRTTRPPAQPRRAMRASMRADHRAVGLVGQDLEQHRVRHAAVDDVHRVDAVLRRVERATRSSAACRREIVPSANSSSISRAVRSVSSLPFLSSTPGVLVSSISFSAFSTSASLPATTSALML